MPHSVVPIATGTQTLMIRRHRGMMVRPTSKGPGDKMPSGNDDQFGALSPTLIVLIGLVLLFAASGLLIAGH